MTSRIKKVRGVKPIKNKNTDWLPKAWKESQKLEFRERIINEFVELLRLELLSNDDDLFYAGRNHGIRRAIYLLTHTPLTPKRRKHV